MEWPLNAAAVLFLAAYAWPILQPSLNSTDRLWCELVTWSIWAVFALNYAIRLSHAKDKPACLTKNLFDLMIIVLPLIRQLRQRRLVTVLSVLNRNAGLSLRGWLVVYMVGATALVVFCSALAVRDAEPEVPIIGFADALWWSIATIGYGDRYPISGTGRIVAHGLMAAGIAPLGVVTATLTSWLIRPVAEADESAQAVTREHLDDLTREVQALRAEPTEQRATESTKSKLTVGDLAACPSKAPK